MGRLKSHKSKSFGFMEAIAFEHKLFVKVVEVGEFLVILMVAVEIGDDVPVVEGNGFSTKVLVGPFATSLDGVEELGGSGLDRE